jgi:hypothetical protein
MSSSSNNNNNHTVFLAALGGIVIGGIAGVTVTKLFSGGGNSGRNDNEDDSSSFLPPGCKSRSLDAATSPVKSPRGYNATTDTTTTVHINFLSDVINRLWPKINVGASKMMREMMEPMFAEMMPGPLKTLKFVKLDLGHVPIVIDNVLVHELQYDPNTKQEYIHWEWVRV